MLSKRIWLMVILLVLPGFSMAHAQRGYLTNDPRLRPLLLKHILPDLRIYIDVKPDDMPFYRDEREGYIRLSLEEIKDAVRLGIGNWKSVLPDMHFRIVDSEAEANLVLRFRDYKKHISRGATAEAFSPLSWKSDPDFSCGKTADGEDNFDHSRRNLSYFPDGRRCDERQNNIILFQLWSGAFYRKHFASSLDRYEWGMASRDRSRSWFRLGTDPLMNTADTSTCSPGYDKNGAPWGVFDPLCVDPEDWEAMPHAKEFSIDSSYADLAYLVQHEFGHTIMGDHTSDMTMGGTYEKNDRDPVYDINYAIRKAELADIVSLPGITAPTSYSIMFSGDGIETTWNIRGVFDLDADRLASGSSCHSEWQGYPAAGWRVTYPLTEMLIKLQNSDTGEIYLTHDWHEAQEMMGWPTHKDGNNHRAHDTRWFQVAILNPDDENVYTITSPNAGDVYKAGEIMPIKWTATEQAQLANIQISFDGGDTWYRVNPTQSIQRGDPLWGDYPFTIPENYMKNGELRPVSSTRCLVRIFEHTSLSLQGFSRGFFEIRQAGKTAGAQDGWQTFAGQTDSITPVDKWREAENFYGFTGTDSAWKGLDEITGYGWSGWGTYAACWHQGDLLEYLMEFGGQYNRLTLRGLADRPGPVKVNIYVDGEKMAQAAWSQADNQSHEIAVNIPGIEFGVHAIAVEFVNDYWDGSGNDDGDRNLYLDALKVTIGDHIRIVSDGSWKSFDSTEEGWTQPGFEDCHWRYAYAPYPSADSPSSWIPDTTAQFIWDWSGEGTPDGTNGPRNVYLRKVFQLPWNPEEITSTRVLVAVDDDFELYVNGHSILKDFNGEMPAEVYDVDIRPYLVDGDNVLALYGRDTFGGTQWALLEAVISTAPPAAGSLVYEGFAYAPGEALHDQGGVSAGWGGPWQNVRSIDWHKVLLTEGSLEAAGPGASGNHAVMDNTTAHLYRPLEWPAGGEAGSEVWLSFVLGDDDGDALNALALVDGGSSSDGGSRLYDRRLFSIEITGQGDQRAFRIKKHWASDQWISPTWDDYGAGSVPWTPGDHLVVVRISIGEQNSDAAAWIDPADPIHLGEPHLTLEGNGNGPVSFDGILWYVEPFHAPRSARLDEIRIANSLPGVTP